MTKILMTKTNGTLKDDILTARFGNLENSDFGFVSDFEIRASDLILMDLDDAEKHASCLAQIYNQPTS